jgi:hypothetical protein
MYKIAEQIYNYCENNNLSEFCYVCFDRNINIDIELGFNIHYYIKSESLYRIYKIIDSQSFRYFKTRELNKFIRTKKLKYLL